MPHFCMDEVIAFMAAIPFVGYFLLRGRHMWHRIWHKGPPKVDGCCPPGHEHPEESPTPIINKEIQ